MGETINAPRECSSMSHLRVLPASSIRSQSSMAPTQLRCRDLKGGDIMLQHNLGNVAGKAIAFGQFMSGLGHSEIIHAGVMFDSSFIVESLGKGVVANDIRTGNAKCGYVVYRPHNAMLGTVAGNFVKLLFDQHGIVHNLAYSTTGAIGSLGSAGPARSAAKLDAMMDEIFTGKPSPFFCSQFVVVAYQIAAGQLGMSPQSVFALDDAKVPPARLATYVEQSAAFNYVGYLLPNER